MDVIDTRTPSLALDVPVLIIGAGPAGLVTAIGLARQGVRSMVVERHPSTSIFPRATGVSLRSMEIFRGWGIDDEIRRGGWRVKPVGATVSRLDDRYPVESPLGFPDPEVTAAISPAIPAVSPQDHLEPVLVEHYRSLGMGEIRFSTELVSFDQDGSCVVATVRDRETGALATIRAGYLVGADGHRSVVRDALGIAMEGPDDLGQYLSILFRADLSEVLGETVYGLYMIDEGGSAGRGGAPAAGPTVGRPPAGGPPRPPTVLVPSGADDRFVFAIPLPPGMDPAAIATAYPLGRCIDLIREAAARPGLEVEILATNSFAFSAQVASRTRDGRVFLVGDAAHRMTPRGGRGMNTAIADAFDLAWKLAWVTRGFAAGSLLESYAAERGPVGRRNVTMSMTPGGGGSNDGLAEDLGSVYASDWIVDDGTPAPADTTVYVPDARPGARAPHAWLGIGSERISTLDLFGRELVLLTAGDATAWRSAVADMGTAHPVGRRPAPISVRNVGRWLRDVDGTFARTYGLEDGGAVLVRPDGVVAWRSRTAPADHRRALATAIETVLGGPAMVRSVAA